MSEFICGVCGVHQDYLNPPVCKKGEPHKWVKALDPDLIHPELEAMDKIYKILCTIDDINKIDRITTWARIRRADEIMNTKSKQ